MKKNILALSMAAVICCSSVAFADSKNREDIYAFNYSSYTVGTVLTVEGGARGQLPFTMSPNSVPSDPITTILNVGSPASVTWVTASDLTMLDKSGKIAHKYHCTYAKPTSLSAGWPITVQVNGYLLGEEWMGVNIAYGGGRGIPGQCSEIK